MSNEAVDSTPLDRLRSGVAMRPQTDRQLSTVWVLLPTADVVYSIGVVAYFIVQAISTVFGCLSQVPPSGGASQYSDCFFSHFAGLFDVTPYLQIVWFIFGAGYAYLVFLLVRRRNTHFTRLKRLKTDLIAALREIQRSRSIDVEADLIQAEAVIREAEPNEREKSAILFALLVLVIGIPLAEIIGFVALLYSLYFLQQDWQKHDEREDRFLRWVQHACYQLGAPFNLVRTKSVPKRSGGLYIVAAIFTVGIFFIYWVYTLINDPRAHLKDHAQSEDNLLAALGGVSPPTSATSHPASP